MAIHITQTLELPNELIGDVRTKFDRDDKRITIREFMTLVMALLGGARRGYVRTQVASACAIGTVECDQSDAVDDTDTVTIAGTALAVKAAPATTAQFAKGDTDAEFATNLANCINANATLAKIVRATADDDLVTITALLPGPLGNLITLSEAGNGLTISGAVFTLGSADAPYGAELGYVPSV